VVVGSGGLERRCFRSRCILLYEQRADCRVRVERRCLTSHTFTVSTECGVTIGALVHSVMARLTHERYPEPNHSAEEAEEPDQGVKSDTVLDLRGDNCVALGAQHCHRVVAPKRDLCDFHALFRHVRIHRHCRLRWLHLHILHLQIHIRPGLLHWLLWLHCAEISNLSTGTNVK
jgi:hypothetical protein